MRPKVLFVINSLASGGAERVFSTLLHGSAARARDCAAVLLDREPEAYDLPSWLPVHRLDCQGSLARSLTGLAAVVRQERPDMALSFLTRANVATAATMWARRAPFIVSERVNTTAHLGDGWRGLASKLPVRLAYPRAHSVIAVSQGVTDTLVADFAVRSDRIAVVANPVDLDRIGEFASAEPEFRIDGPYVAAMGRLAPNKNFALAVRAFATAGLDGRLVIMGQGPEEASLRRLGDELGLGPVGPARLRRQPVRGPGAGPLLRTALQRRELSQRAGRGDGVRRAASRSSRPIAGPAPPRCWTSIRPRSGPGRWREQAVSWCPSTTRSRWPRHLGAWRIPLCAPDWPRPGSAGSRRSELSRRCRVTGRSSTTCWRRAGAESARVQVAGAARPC